MQKYNLEGEKKNSFNIWAKARRGWGAVIPALKGGVINNHHSCELNNSHLINNHGPRKRDLRVYAVEGNILVVRL